VIEVIDGVIDGWCRGISALGMQYVMRIGWGRILYSSTGYTAGILELLYLVIRFRLFIYNFTLNFKLETPKVTIPYDGFRIIKPRGAHGEDKMTMMVIRLLPLRFHLLNN
jgi:hypothetical protein